MNVFDTGNVTTDTLKKLRLNTLEHSTKTFARILRARAAGKISSKFYRDMVYGMSNYLAYWKLIKDCQIEQKMEAIIESLDKAGVKV